MKEWKQKAKTRGNNSQTEEIIAWLQTSLHRRAADQSRPQVTA